MKKWKCTICGEIVESDTRPEKCPLCRAPGEKFVEIVSSSEYQTVYKDANGKDVNKTVRSTDLFIRTDKDVNAPAGITVIGGKTGTTGGAGHCLIVLCKDSSGNPYISCVMGTPDADTLYAHQKELMSLILNS